MFRSFSGFKSQYHYLNLVVASEFDGWKVLIYSPGLTIHGARQLTENSAKEHAVAVARSWEEALTRFRVLKRLKGFTYVEAYPRTGRTHQIRVHLALIGHPIVGDPVYGKRARKEADRPLLHAFRLSFTHPVSGTRLTLEAPVPDDISRFVSDHAV